VGAFSRLTLGRTTTGDTRRHGERPFGTKRPWGFKSRHPDRKKQHVKAPFRRGLRRPPIVEELVVVNLLP
jgi:hypothetical protein